MSSKECEIKLLRNDNQIKMGKRTYIWLGITKNDPEFIKEIIKKEPIGKKINLHIVISKVADINKYLFEALIYMHTVNNNIRLEIHIPMWNKDLYYLLLHKIDEHFLFNAIDIFNGYITLDNGIDFTMAGSIGNKLKIRYNDCSVHALVDTVYSTSDNKTDMAMTTNSEFIQKLQEPDKFKDDIIKIFKENKPNFINMFKTDNELFDYIKRFYGGDKNEEY